MADNYPLARVGDLAESISETHRKNKQYLIFLNTSDILHGKFLHRTYTVVRDWPGQAKKSIQKDDILFSEIRPANGRWAYVDEDADDFVVSTKLMVIRARKDRLFPKFFYQFLTSSAIAAWLQHLAESRSGTFPQITFDQISSLGIPLPSLLEQQAIACILGALDDKIELNRRMNETLEAMARAIFKSWFVEEAEENWEKGRLGNILESIESGSRPKGGIDPELKTGIPSIGAENINGLGYYNYSKTKFITENFFDKMNRGIISDYDVLIYKDGAYIGRKSMFGNGFPFEKCCVNEHVFILRGNKKINQFFLYFLLKQDELEQLNANSAQPGLNQESMKSYEIIIPTSEAIQRFGEMVKPCVDKIFFNCNQSRILAAIRDALLPKLISGELRVPEAERIVERAA